MPNPPDTLNQSFYEKNLKLLAMRDPRLAQAVGEAAMDGVAWTNSPQGLSATVLNDAGKPMALGSKYRPQDEAEKLIANVDIRESTTFVLVGLGLGYHAAKLGEMMRGKGVLIVYEPSVLRLKVALHTASHASWLVHPNLVLIVGESNRAQLTGLIEPYAAMVTQGTKLITHPPTRRLDSDAIQQFNDDMTQTVSFCRTTIATTLVNSSRTYSNLANNLADYAAGPNVGELENLCKGHMAVCVSAGPSLVKNVHLLKDPAIRKNIVVIAVQTALKPLLDRGITPDFVTALDYSAICRRFYESLPPMPRTTLVAEAKAHPVILESYPGPTRLLYNKFNDQLLGDAAPQIPAITAGATVAHLSFYLAQFLGCDPIAFIGQDLAFSNGLYYCPGTAVHDVWSSELNPFSTIENYEWERVVRHKSHLSRQTDQNGQPAFSDEQMMTYLKQFERDFDEAEQRVLDCTEGGMPKANSEPMPFAQAIEQFATQPTPDIPHPPKAMDAARAQSAMQHVRNRRDEVDQMRHITEQSKPILRQMTKDLNNPAKFKKLHEKLDKNRRRAEGDLKPALDLATQLNAVGAFRRLKNDHRISHTPGKGNSDHDTQVRAAQIERDQDNLKWLAEACQEALDILDASILHMQSRIQSVPQVAIVAHHTPTKDAPNAGTPKPQELERQALA